MNKRQRKKQARYNPDFRPVISDYRSEFDLRLDVDYLVSIQKEQFERRVFPFGLKFVGQRQYVPKLTNRSLKQKLSNQSRLLDASIADVDLLYNSGFISQDEREQRLRYINKMLQKSKPSADDLLWDRFEREAYFKRITSRTVRNKNGIRVVQQDATRYMVNSYLMSDDFYVISNIAPNIGAILKRLANDDPSQFAKWIADEEVPMGWDLSNTEIIYTGILSNPDIYISEQEMDAVLSDMSNWDDLVKEDRLWARKN